MGQSRVFRGVLRPFPRQATTTEVLEELIPSYMSFLAYKFALSFPVEFTFHPTFSTSSRIPFSLTNHGWRLVTKGMLFFDGSNFGRYQLARTLATFVPDDGNAT